MNLKRHFKRKKKTEGTFCKDFSSSNCNKEIDQGLKLFESGNLLESELIFTRIINRFPNNDKALLCLGVIYDRRGKMEEALDLFKRALAANPENVEALYNIGFHHKTTGRLEESRACFEKAVSIRPDYALSHFMISRLKKYSCNDEHIFEMESLFSKNHINATQKMYLAFGLGKAYEESGIYEKAFYYFREGNKLKRNTEKYSTAETEAQFKQIKRLFTKSFILNNSKFGNPDDTPIFIVGMPRSGTSLVEQILASHPDVYGAGELAYIGQLISSLSADDIDDEEMIITLGREYLQKIRKLSPKSKFITDKMPLNFKWIGAIFLSLPNAKIISCLREPMDNCLSIYKTYFATGNKFSSDLRELGQFYLLYQNLMQYWHEVFPGKIYEISYEKLVHDQEAETRKLLKHCGLSWNDQCISFHKTSRVVGTASDVQVRKPIYKDSLQLWKHYEIEMKPLQEILLKQNKQGA